MSSSVTPSIAPADGSTSRGIAMSTISIGRPSRPAIAVDRSACSSMIVVAPVDVSSRSACASSPGRSARRTARPPNCAGECTSGFPRAVGDDDVVRTGGGDGNGHALRHLARAEQQHPASRQAIRADRVAIATAACATEVMPRPMPVSVRTRLPTSSAWRNSRFSADPVVALGTGPFPCVADLAEDLALADDRRVESGRDREQVRDRGLVVVDVEVAGERRRAGGTRDR